MKLFAPLLVLSLTVPALAHAKAYKCDDGATIKLEETSDATVFYLNGKKIGELDENGLSPDKGHGFYGVNEQDDGSVDVTVFEKSGEETGGKHCRPE